MISSEHVLSHLPPSYLHPHLRDPFGQTLTLGAVLFVHSVGPGNPSLTFCSLRCIGMFYVYSWWDFLDMLSLK